YRCAPHGQIAAAIMRSKQRGYTPMSDYNGREKHDGEFNEEDGAGVQDDQPHDEQVSVGYVSQRRCGPLTLMADTRRRIQSAGRRWVEVSVDQPLKHQDQLPQWVHTARGRWIIVGVLAIISLAWIILFGLMS